MIKSFKIVAEFEDGKTHEWDLTGWCIQMKMTGGKAPRRWSDGDPQLVYISVPREVDLHAFEATGETVFELHTLGDY